MNILFAGSECLPFIKTGGLADVLSALPKAIALKENASVILPKYKEIKNTENAKLFSKFDIKIADETKPVIIEKLAIDKVDYYFVANEEYFGSRENLYSYSDDNERFAFFQLAIIEFIKQNNNFDILHCNDWHTGVLPLLIRINKLNLKTIFTIHNIAYQGVFDLNSYKLFNIKYENTIEFNEQMNYMKTAIMSADIITTVSETYSGEILYDFYGYGMENVLKYRLHDIYGILNGVDYSYFNPLTNNDIHFNYDISNYEDGKLKNKKYLLELLGLNPQNEYPVIGIVSRLASQKGIDLIMRIIEELLQEKDIYFILLGTGDKEYEDFFKTLQYKYNDKVRAYIGYQEALANQIYAGSDMFLMPSLFEPCGLGQLIALKYGTLPIVRETGGLKDTVNSYNKYTKEGNGFTFKLYNAHDMLFTIKDAIDLYNENKDDWNTLIKQAMNENFDWEISSNKYIDLYKKLLK